VKPDRRRRTKRWLLAAGTTLALVLGLELALQGVYRVSNGAPLARRMAIPVYAPDPHRGWRVRSNLDYPHSTNEYSVRYVTDAAGFRVGAAGAAVPRAKPAGTYRVLLLGPSFAFGWGVEHADSYAVHLERALGGSAVAAGRTVEVVNAGVPGLFPANQRAWYEAEGKTYEPDLVVQLLYNSLHAAPQPNLSQRVTDAGLLVPTSDVTLGRRLRGWGKNSALVFYAFLLQQRVLARAPEDLESPPETTPPADRPPLAEASLDHYRSLQVAVERSGAKLAFVFAPPSYAVHPEDLPRWRHLGVAESDVQAKADHAQRACAWLQQALRVPCVNLTPALQDAARGPSGRLYHWLDVHWTPRGNRLAAEETARRLSRAGSD
jgi:hypothetical protein